MKNGCWVHHHLFNARNILQADWLGIAPIQNQVTQRLDFILAAETQSILTPANFLVTPGNICIGTEFLRDTGQVQSP